MSRAMPIATQSRATVGVNRRTSPWMAARSHLDRFGCLQRSRAFDILAALVEHAGEVVSKKELIARVWPKTFVEDANLKIQVSALRRALGDGQGGHRYVITVPGRGYNFVAPVGLEKSSRAPP